MDLTKTKIRTTNQICFTNSHSWDEKTKRVKLYCTCSFASSTLNNCESNHDRCSPKEGWMYLFLRLQQRQLGFIEVVIFIGRKGINPEAENKCCNNAKPEEVPHSHSGCCCCLFVKETAHKMHSWNSRRSQKVVFFLGWLIMAQTMHYVPNTRK